MKEALLSKLWRTFVGREVACLSHVHLHHLINPHLVVLFFILSSLRAGPCGAWAGQQWQDAAAGGCSKGLVESRQGVEPRVSWSLSKPCAVKKRVYFQRSDPADCMVWGNFSLSCGNVQLPGDEQPLPQNKHWVFAERVKLELMVAICAQLNTNPPRAGLSPVVVDLIDSDGHSTGSGKQAVPPVPCYWASAEEGGCWLT